MLEDSLLGACRDGNTELVMNLLQEHETTAVHPNMLLQGSGLLHHAVDAGHPDMVLLLLSHPRIEANIQDGAGMTPIHLACSQGRDKIVRIMGRGEIYHIICLVSSLFQ